MIRSVFAMANLSDRDPSLPRLFAVLPTRVRRNYRGGMLLDRLEGSSAPIDSDRPESWIASTIEAVNPGLPPQVSEGLTRLKLADGIEITLAALIAGAPDFYLGARHAETMGTQLGFLAKLLDSSMRLHVQAHPSSSVCPGAARCAVRQTRGLLRAHGSRRRRRIHPLGISAFSRARPVEAHHRGPGYRRDGRVLRCDPGETRRNVACAGRPASRDRRRCPGGGGDGTKRLVVRCEFEREGVIVPPAGRFMGRGVDFCLDVFDYGDYPVAEVRRRFCLTPARQSGEPGWVRGSTCGPRSHELF